MIVVYVSYDGKEKHWKYHYLDLSGFKVTTTGFENHLKAVEHLKDKLGHEVEIKFK